MKKVEIYLMKEVTEKVLDFYEIDYTNDYIKDKELRIVHFGLVNRRLYWKRS